MLDFSEIYEEIIGRVGGEQSTAEDVIRAERSVRIVLERWAARRYPTWRLRQMRALASGVTPQVELPEEVDDVMQVNTVLGSDITLEARTAPMTRIPPSVYMQISSKYQQGVPSQYWLDRSATPRLHIHPIGTPTTPSVLEVWYAARPPEFRRGSPGSDEVPGRWTEALILACAHDMARKRPKEGGGYDEALIARLEREAGGAEGIALDADRDRSRYTYRIGR